MLAARTRRSANALVGLTALLVGGAMAGVAALTLVGLVMAFDGAATHTSPAPESSALYNSMVLDENGNPAIAFFDAVNGDLRMLRCNDVNCAGGDDSVTTTDTAGDVGRYPSLRLDATGNPVVIYFDQSKVDWKVMHCNDANCSGGDESITQLGIGQVATIGQVGPSSFVLDAADRPVFSFSDGTLKIFRCGNPNCTASNTVTSPDAEVGVGAWSSLALDVSGNPVVSYSGNGSLKVLRCGNADCTTGNTINEPDTNASRGITMVLDDSDYPVISYDDDTNTLLKLVRCNDTACAGGNETIRTLDSLGVFTGPTILLDSLDRPAVAWWHRDSRGTRLVLLHCLNPTCFSRTSVNVASSAAISNSVPFNFPSLALDTADKPVFSYGQGVFDGEFRGYELRVVHCGDAACEKATAPTETPTPTPLPCPGGKVSEGTECGTPTISAPHTSGGPELLLTVADEDCVLSSRPVTCDVPVGAEFTALVKVEAAPPEGYILLQTFIDFGETLAYMPSADPAAGIVWPECLAAFSSQAFGRGKVLHGCLTGLLPPLPVSFFVGEAVELQFSCSEAASSNFVRLLPNDNPSTITSGTLFVRPDTVRVVPKLNAMVVNCVAPAAVGGISLDSDLRALPLETTDRGSSPWIVAATIAAAASLLAVGGAAWYARWRSPERPALPPGR